MSTTISQAEREAAWSRCEARRDAILESLRQLSPDDPFNETFSQLAGMSLAQRIAAIRQSVELGTLDGDYALVLVELLGEAGGSGVAEVARRFTEAMSRQRQIEDALVTLAGPRRGVVVERDANGDAIAYRPATDDDLFNLEVGKLHRRATGG